MFPPSYELLILVENIFVILFSLLESSLDLAVPRALTVSINEHVLEVLMSHVESCGWKMTIDVGNIKTMLTVVGSVIGTKPACHLTESEMRFVSVLLIQVNKFFNY